MLKVLESMRFLLVASVAGVCCDSELTHLRDESDVVRPESRRRLSLGATCLLPQVPGEAAPSGEAIGNPCSADAECGGGLICLRSDTAPFGVGGGPAGGYCSLACEFQDVDCAGGLCQWFPVLLGGLCPSAPASACTPPNPLPRPELFRVPTC